MPTLEDYIQQLLLQPFPTPPEVAKIAGLALQLVSQGQGISSLKLPVRFYNGTPPGPTQVGWYFDDNLAVPGWTGLWMGPNALAPNAGNGALLWKNDDTVLQIGSAGVGLILIPVETEFTGGVVTVGQGFFLNGGAFVSGSGQPWKEAVSGAVDLTAGGTITINTPTTDNPMLIFTGTLPGDTHVVFPNTPGAVWDISLVGVNVGGHALIFQTGAAARVVAVEAAQSGCRVGVFAADSMALFGIS